MVSTWNLVHSKDGTSVELQEVPLWAYLVNEASDWLLDVTHPAFCCSDWNWAWKLAWSPPPEDEKPDEDGYIYNPNTVGHALHMFGQHLGNGFGAWRKCKTRSRVPVTSEWVREHFPEMGWPWDGSSGDEAGSGPEDEGDVQL